MIQDSGTRREFESGAVRDIQEGKGRCDLLPLKEIAKIYRFIHFSDAVYADILSMIGDYENTGAADFLSTVVYIFGGACGWELTDMCLEVAKHYEEGCNKYGERNWEKGIPLHCFIDSGVRHLLKHMRGDTDERHDRAFVWNMLGAMWTQNNHPELCDLPFAQKKTTEAAEE